MSRSQRSNWTYAHVPSQGQSSTTPTQWAQKTKLIFWSSMVTTFPLSNSQGYTETSLCRGRWAPQHSNEFLSSYLYLYRTRNISRFHKAKLFGEAVSRVLTADYSISIETDTGHIVGATLWLLGSTQAVSLVISIATMVNHRTMLVGV